MARVEADREDLFRESVAMVRRIEFHVKDENHPVLVGYRPTRWLSIYFGADLMYQFDERGRLRRAYADGILYRTQGSVLAQLERRRTDSETTLVRNDLDGQRLSDFRQRTHDDLRRFQVALHHGDATIVRQFPADDHCLVKDLSETLELILNSKEFLAPAIQR